MGAYPPLIRQDMYKYHVIWKYDVGNYRYGYGVDLFPTSGLETIRRLDFHSIINALKHAIETRGTVYSNKDDKKIWRRE